MVVWRDQDISKSIKIALLCQKARCNGLLQSRWTKPMRLQSVHRHANPVRGESEPFLLFPRIDCMLNRKESTVCEVAILKRLADTGGLQTCCLTKGTLRPKMLVDEGKDAVSPLLQFFDGFRLNGSG